MKNIISIPDFIILAGNIHTNTITIDGEVLDSNMSLRIRYHSPDGFGWGYGGSGPSQLSLAILMKYLPVELALRYYQQFKFNCIATLPQGDFSVRINIVNEIEKILNQ